MRRPILAFLNALLVAVILGLLWEALAWTVDNPISLPDPRTTLRAFQKHHSQILPATGDVIAVGLQAFMTALAIAIVITLLSIFVPFSKRLTAPILIFFRSAPIVVFVPIIYFLDPDPDRTRYIVGVIISLYPLCALPMRRAEQVPREYWEAATAMGASPFAYRMHVELPWSLSGLLEGCRVGGSLTIVGVVVSDMFHPVSNGIGSIINTSYSQSSPGTAIASVVVITAAAYAWTTALEKSTAAAQAFLFGQDQARTP